MGWSNGRELTSLSGNGLTASYTYDASGLRLSKTVNGIKTEYQYQDGKLLYEKKGDMELHYGYDSEGQPRFIQYVKADGSTGLAYLVTNSRGDVVGMCNGNGVMIVNYTYDAWGNILSVTDQNGTAITSAGNIGNLNSLRYRGYYYDTDTKMYYLQSRYYDPEVRRFINADDVSVLAEDQGSIVEHNLFAYCLNNPVNYYDLEGKLAITTCVLIGMGIGAIVGGCLGAYRASKKFKPKDGWCYWKYVVGYGVVGATVGALIGWGAGTLISKYGVTTAAKSITKGGGARFSSFSSLKRSLGPAGKGKEWHHIVEQCQIKKSGFSKYWINNSNNVVNISKSVHRKVSAHYSSIMPGTNGLRVRDWLAKQSFEKQYKYGIKVLRKLGVKI